MYTCPFYHTIPRNVHLATAPFETPPTAVHLFPAITLRRPARGALWLRVRLDLEGLARTEEGYGGGEGLYTGHVSFSSAAGETMDTVMVKGKRLHD